MAGAGLLLLGAVLQITRWDFAPFIYTVGAVMFGYVQVMGNRYDGKNFIVKRLRRQQIFGAIALVFAGVLMFTMNRNEWIVCLSIAAILELYTAFRIPQELDKVKFSQGYPCLTAGYDVDLIAIVFLKSRGPRHNDFGLNSKVIFEQTKDAACQSRIFRRKMNAHFLP